MQHARPRLEACNAALPPCRLDGSTPRPSVMRRRDDEIVPSQSQDAQCVAPATVLSPPAPLVPSGSWCPLRLA
eukprot:scaffold32301_cov135-Isochrysis_galbana.AAC.11